MSSSNILIMMQIQFHEPNEKSSLGFNMLHTISFFNIPSKRYLDVIIQSGREKVSSTPQLPCPSIMRGGGCFLPVNHS
jgi:hypothetical protein